MTAPVKNAMSPFHQRSVRLFGNFVRARLPHERLKEPLLQAHMGIRSEAYASYVLANVLIVSVVMFFFVALPAAVLLPILGVNVSSGVNALILVAPILLGGMMFATLWYTPQSKAKSRAKDIDLKLPYALNYVAAMASAGVIPADIFRSLSRQDIYGEVANEALYIYKDIQLHGKDIVTALRRASDRSPSQKFKELLTGAITTVTSGGDLTIYFAKKAQRHMWENRQDQKNFIEIMGLMAETYVTAAVAGPLFLIVMISIMTMLSGGGPGTLALIVYLLLPIINIGFVMGIMAMIPEV
ncbi:MAG: type II secretion system F family protein [Euryarchaeota archaeon]|nr:type II secretion system F family protein [Euryarchaeota archaeon]